MPYEEDKLDTGERRIADTSRDLKLDKHIAGVNARYIKNIESALKLQELVKKKLKDAEEFKHLGERFEFLFHELQSLVEESEK